VVELEDRRLLATIMVTTPNDPLNPNLSPVAGTLRWAVDQANNASGPTTITFSSTVEPTITLSQQAYPIAITSPYAVTIEGPGAGALAVSGNKFTGIFEIAQGVSATITGLTFTDSFTGYSAVVDSGSLDISDCDFTDDVAVTAKGGGLSVPGTATVSNCTFTDDSATYGGALYIGGTATVSDCTITGSSGLFTGGGISNGGTATLIDCTITGNHGQSGGGVYDKGKLTITGCTISDDGITMDGTIDGGALFEKGTGTVSDSTISDSYAVGDGGDIYNEGSLTVNNCTITGADTRQQEPTAAGGAIANVNGGTASFTNCAITGGNAWVGGNVANESGSTLELIDCLVTGGSAISGGGVYNSASAVLKDCTLNGNVAYNGGGIANGLLNANAPLTAIDCTISGNSATSTGGGVANNGIITLTDCTIANNSSNSGFMYSGGGGINNSGVATLVACTVSGNNSTNQGGGIYDGGDNPDLVTLKLYDSIVGGNTITTSGGTAPNDIGINDSSAGRNFITGSYNLIGTGGDGGLVGSNNIDLGSMSSPPPLGLAPLGDYGGPTETMALLPSSLAIGNGSQGLELDSNGNPLTGDQRGFAFDSPKPDIGAYQHVLVPLVVTVATDGGGAPLGELDLRAAVNLDDLQAKATAITFDATAFAAAQTITLAGGQLELSNTSGTMTITGPAAGVTVSGDQLSRIFQIDKNVTATISGLTIADGLTSTAAGGSVAGYGGGLLNLGTTTLTDCTVTGNSAAIGGGGLANSGNSASLTLTNSVVTDNQTGTSGAGGGIDSPFFDSLTLSGTTISGNSAATGGGLVSLAMATLTNCTITGNTAKTFGGGVYDNDGTIELTGCTISANIASSGAGLFIDGSGTLVACTLVANSSGGNLDNEGAVTLTNCTLANSAGFGLLNEYGTVKLIACTVTGNQNQGLANYFSNGTGTITLTDTIVAGNTSGSTAADIGGLAPNDVTGTYNLVGVGGSGGLANDGTNELDVSNPGLAPVGAYGGTTQTVALLPGSPAIGAGTAVAGVTTDERGLPLDSPTPDIGAFQSQGFTFTALGATADSVAPGASVTLAVTVSAKNPSEPVAGGIVTFDAGSSGGASATLAGSPATIGTAEIGGTTYANAAVVTATANATSGTYTVETTAAGAATPVDFTLTNLIELGYSGPGLANQTITYGTSSVTISGTLASGANAPVGETVQLTLVNGPTQAATIGTGGAFSATFTNTASLGVTGSPYTFDLTYAGDATFAPASATLKLMVTPAKPTISWQNPADITYGTALSSTQLDASANAMGTFSYTPALGKLLGAGAGQQLSVTFTPKDLVDYTTATGTATINVEQATPTIHWNNPADITYGTSLSNTQLDATASWIVGGSTVSVNGKFTYTPAAGTVLTAGAGQTLSVSFTPNDATDFTTGKGTATINVNKATPTIAWSEPADITYGTVLGSAQLDATASWTVGGVKQSVSGSFDYTPGNGTVLPAGSGQSLSVSFTPSDTNDYVIAAGNATINVDPAAPVITWPNPADINFGAALTNTQLDATANVAGTFQYTPAAGTVLPAGKSEKLSVTFTPDDSVDYRVQTATAIINVNKPAPILTWTDPSDITYGTALSTAQLNATASVAGTFQYTPAPGTYLPAGSNQALSVVFTPTDSADYGTASMQVTINVAKATPNLGLTDPGGTYDGSPFVASATLTGVGGDHSSGGSLQGISPTLTYYVGNGTAGTNLGSAAPLAPGTYTVVAAFPGNSDYRPVVSPPVVFTIKQATANLALSSTGGSAVYGQGVTFVATLSAAVGTPTGTVTFLDGGSPLDTVAVNASGLATFSTASLSPGSHSITAIYNGSSFFEGAGSAATSESVARGSAHVILVAHPVLKKKKPVSFNLTAEITPSATGGAAPSGTVIFELVTKTRKKVTTKVLGTAGVSSGNALLTVRAKSVLGKAITVVYNGDGDFLGSMAIYPKLTSKGL
jgi:hypothetical protein